MGNYYRTRSNKRYGYRQRSIGHERALQHIREAEELSEELGGIDEDVKKYFFSLSGKELKAVLYQYDNRYGRIPREYAEKTIPLWRSGRRKMSGLVADRLFKLLPPRMPLDTKYNLVKTLWEKYSPRSNKRLRIGPGTDANEIIEAVKSQLLEMVVNYKIPDQLEHRFRWLSSGDVNVYQKLLNHFQNIEKSLIIEGTQAKLPIILKHLREHEQITQKISHHIEIGKHKLEMRFDNKAAGITFEDPTLSGLSMHSSLYIGCLIVAVIVIVIIILMAIYK